MFSLATVLLLLQWWQAYILLKDPEEGRVTLVKDTVKRYHYALSAVTITLMIYCVTIAATSNDTLRDEIGQFWWVANLSVYFFICTYRILLTLAYIYVYCALIIFIRGRAPESKIIGAINDGLKQFRSQVHRFFISAILA